MLLPPFFFFRPSGSMIIQSIGVAYRALSSRSREPPSRRSARNGSSKSGEDLLERASVADCLEPRVGRRSLFVVRARKAAKRWFTDRGAQADARRDKALRKVGAGILNEPIPEKLQQALRGKPGKAEVEPKRRK
jgi:hypothetical protein